MGVRAPGPYHDGGRSCRRGVAVGTLGQLQIGERKAALLEATSLQAQQLQQYGTDLLHGESLDSAVTRRIERMLGGDARILIGRISGSQLEFRPYPGWRGNQYSLRRQPMPPSPWQCSAPWPARPAPNGAPAKLAHPPSRLSPGPGAQPRHRRRNAPDLLWKPFVNATSRTALVGIVLIIAGNALSQSTARTGHPPQSRAAETDLRACGEYSFRCDHPETDGGWRSFSGVRLQPRRRARLRQGPR